MRGDQLVGPIEQSLPGGTPPRAWGSVVLADTLVRGRRDTPTCVGISHRRLLEPRHRPGHPHVRGDQVRRQFLEMEGSGTPPRAWGSGGSTRRCALRERDTPTCVGISSPGPSREQLRAGHPHVRGDQAGLPASSAPRGGTPPRAWGSASRGYGNGCRRRDTPTCVGISYPTPPRRSSWPGHPHVRGDQPPSNPQEQLQRGTPPRAWGSVLLVQPGVGAGRDTPTCVGIS